MTRQREREQESPPGLLCFALYPHVLLQHAQTAALLLESSASLQRGLVVIHLLLCVPGVLAIGGDPAAPAPDGPRHLLGSSLLVGVVPSLMRDRFLPRMAGVAAAPCGRGVS